MYIRLYWGESERATSAHMSVCMYVAIIQLRLLHTGSQDPCTLRLNPQLNCQDINVALT